MAAANRDLLKGKLSDGTGQVDGDGAEADCSVGLLDVVDSEPGDLCGPPPGRAPSGPLGHRERQFARGPASVPSSATRRPQHARDHAIPMTCDSWWRGLCD